MQWHPLGPALWIAQADEGEATAANRGMVSHLWWLEEEGTLWMIGSGPSPRWGEALQAVLRAQWPRHRLNVLSPWAHPESVLGVRSLTDASHWAHRAVATEMAQRCPTCWRRLQARLGAAAGDLGPGPDTIRLPERLLDGDTGRWGPWWWKRLQRAADVTVTAWIHPAGQVGMAPGLLGGAGVPDARDADIWTLPDEIDALLQWARSARVTRWWGGQGPVRTLEDVRQQQAYWRALWARADAGVQADDDGLVVGRGWPGIPPAWFDHPWHALNWQRAWRQAESRWLQRSLR